MFVIDGDGLSCVVMGSLLNKARPGGIVWNVWICDRVARTWHCRRQEIIAVRRDNYEDN